MEDVPARRLVALLAVAATATALLVAAPDAPVLAQTPGVGGFEDVPEDAYYSLPVSTLTEQGIFAGTLCGEGFCPGEPIDRKTMSVWVVRILDGEDPEPVSQTRFDDVDAASFYAPFVERMAELGVTQGCGDGSGYCPDRTVNRAQMAAFLSRAYGLASGPDPGFSDVANDAWYAADAARLAASGITRGCGDGTRFCPDRDTTRAQMATFLYRAENPGELEEPAEEQLSAVMDGGGIISAGGKHSCALRSNEAIVCWGGNSAGQADAPAGAFTAVSAGGSHSCGIRADQTITCWGWDSSGRTSTPSGSFIAITAQEHSCAIRTDQTAVCWGPGSGGATDAPTGAFTAVTAGGSHSCGIRVDRTIRCWGWNGRGQADAPSGTFTAVSAGDSHSCGLRTDRTIVCWGLNDNGEATAPTGTYIAVTASARHSCGLRTDQTIVCWGSNYGGATDAPTGAFTAVTVGGGHSCGLRTDQVIVCWGLNDHRQLIVEDTDDDAGGSDDNAGEPQRPGRPRNIRIDWVEGVSLTVHWQAPDSGGDVHLYAVDRSVVGEELPSVQGRTGPEFVSPITGRLHATLAFGANLQDDGHGNYSYVIYFDRSKNETGSNDIASTDAVRVVASNDAGFAISDVVEVSSLRAREHEELRSFVLEIVSEYRASVPWLGEVWEYIREREAAPTPLPEVFGIKGFRFSTRTNSYTIAGVASIGRDCEDARTLICKAAGDSVSVTSNSSSRWMRRVTVHELGHIYTKSNDAPSNPLAIVAGYLYLLDLLSSYGYSDVDCGVTELTEPDPGADVDELYAEVAAYTLLAGTDPYYSGLILTNWQRCLAGAPENWIEVARSTLDGDIPQWFYDTYRHTDGSYDLDALWADVSFLSSSDWEFVVYAFKDKFGGYCNLYSYEGNNPWRDGGCQGATTPTADFVAVTAGQGFSCALRSDGTAECWGSPSVGDAPGGQFTALSGNCGIHADGSLECWGLAEDPPGGQFTAVSAGRTRRCGVRADGSVECWRATGERAGAPPGEFVVVSMGAFHACGVRVGGTVECWNPDEYGVEDLQFTRYQYGATSPPAGAFSSVSSGDFYSCGIVLDGTMTCWGINSTGRSNAPAGNFSAVSAGGSHACALRVDGTMVCWGDNAEGQSNAPAGNFIAVAAGGDHSCGVRADGSLECWGSNTLGQAPPVRSGSS